MFLELRGFVQINHELALEAFHFLMEVKKFGGVQGPLAERFQSYGIVLFWLETLSFQKVLSDLGPNLFCLILDVKVLQSLVEIIGIHVLRNLDA